MKRCPFCAEAIQEAAVVCRFCGRELGASGDASPASGVARVLRGGEILLGVGGLVLVAYLLVARAGALPFAVPAGIAAGFTQEPPAPPPLVLSLIESESMDLRAGEHFDSTFRVTDPRACTFSGRVRGVAGGDRDVEVYLLDEAGYDQWHEGVHPAALFESGRASEASFEVPLPGTGRYSLLLSNRFSVFTDKRVRVDAARVVCQ